MLFFIKREEKNYNIEQNFTGDYRRYTSQMFLRNKNIKSLKKWLNSVPDNDSKYIVTEGDDHLICLYGTNTQLQRVET